MAVDSVRKVFWMLLTMEAILIVFNGYAELKILRITEFSESGSLQMWSLHNRILHVGIATTYILTIIISVGSKKLLQIESPLSRMWNLGMTIMWPCIIFLLYYYIVGYPAS